MKRQRAALSSVLSVYIRRGGGVIISPGVYLHEVKHAEKGFKGAEAGAACHGKSPGLKSSAERFTYLWFEIRSSHRRNYKGIKFKASNKDKRLG